MRTSYAEETAIVTDRQAASPRTPAGQLRAGSLLADQVSVGPAVETERHLRGLYFMARLAGGHGRAAVIQMRPARAVAPQAFAEPAGALSSSTPCTNEAMT